MNWDDLRFFLAVARDGSSRAGAKKLGVNQSTVTRRINKLEKKVGTRLFDRMPTGYIMTPAAEDILELAIKVEDDIASLDRRIFGRDTELSGTLRVTIAEAIANHLLMPDIAAFAAMYPGIRLELVLSFDEFNLSKRESDVAIRAIDHDPPDYLVGKKLASYAKSIYASTAYLKNNNLEEPSNLQWIGWDDSELYPKWVKDTYLSSTPVYHQLNDLLGQLAAVKAGLGLSILPCFLADPEPTLQRVPPGELMPSRDIWILTHKDLRFTARVRHFIDFMSETTRRHQKLLDGT